MRAFHSAGPGSGRIGVEVHPCLGEGDDRVTTGLAQNAHGLLVAVSGTCRERIGDMGGDRVVGADDTGDAALCPFGVRLAETILCHECDRVASGQAQCRGQPRDPGACDDDATHQIRGFAASIRSRDTRAGSATSASTEIWLTTWPSMRDSRTQAM